MKHNEIQFRSKRERESEVRLEDNYRQLGNPTLLTAARYVAAKRAAQPKARVLPQFAMSAE
ncbi:hypothetical protein U0C82_15150 [Fulvimarina sp. 2208YS6-2-32]|uniref:Transcriptional regulator n=1 Tax=Fulvimarina uroteuthidis TaxID=3098149 RepID=A0ABU5I6E0_9HYPH|nr:hypothetical protein [Fulvimarina sp. 2208YS6-2-32]MDY8110478.1 hypothetical protein [Fulvimarina sp. 2208YS6-2-32]